MHQGIAPAIDPFEGGVIGAVKSLGVLAQQAGLGELVTVAGGQGHHLIGAIRSFHMGLQVAVGMDQRGKGPDGIDRHGKQGNQSQAD